MLLNFFSDGSYCEVEIEKTFLVRNSNDNGIVEMSNVRLILPPRTICGGTNCTAKIWFEKVFLFTCV